MQSTLLAPPARRLQVPAQLELPPTSSETLYFELWVFRKQGLVTEPAESRLSKMIMNAKYADKIQIAWHDLVVTQYSGEHLSADVELSLRVATIDESV